MLSPLGLRATAITAFGLSALTLAPPSARPPQDPRAPVDFARDVQPLLKEHCIKCHGPEEQKNGFRLDRRSRAFHGVLRPNIIPGSSETSRLYQRVAGTVIGTRMPPDGPLAPEEITLLQRWIDEGAEWPDGLANEAEWAAADPDATRLVEAIRAGDRRTVNTTLQAHPGSVKAGDREGTTPLMAAALRGDHALVSRIVQLRADVNASNHAGATALMWALDDVAIVRLLLRHGADPNAVSEYQRSVVQLAAGQHGHSAEVVKLLLDAGGEPKVAALTAAATAGNLRTVQLLLAAGVIDNDNGDATLGALRAGWIDCFEAIRAASPNLKWQKSLLTLLPPQAPVDEAALRIAIERGADVNLRSSNGLTPLMRAAIGETPTESVTLLLQHGADPLARSAEGRTALEYAGRLGRTRAVETLSRLSHTDPTQVAPKLSTTAENSVEGAVRRSLPLLQRTGVAFYAKSGCVSCHSNILTAITVAAARDRGFAVDEALARSEAQTLADDVRKTRDLALQGLVMPGGGPATTGYVLIGLATQGYARDDGAIALTQLLRRAQRRTGAWAVVFRPPSESSAFTAAAVAIRGLQLYGSTEVGSPDKRTIGAAVRWLLVSKPAVTEDRVFRLFGLTWGQAPRTAVREAATALALTQRADGGWAQLATLESDAYATGSALVALKSSGLSADDPVYRRGMAFLLKTQCDDGSWFVAKRAHPTQTFFDSGFPHDRDQYISAAATNWATLALLLSRDAPGEGSFVLGPAHEGARQARTLASSRWRRYRAPFAGVTTMLR